MSAAHDENTVLFSSEIEFAKARRFIEAKVAAKNHHPTLSATEHGLSVAEQLEKLAALLDRGLLTRDEFNAQKKKLLLQNE
ncbi:SHOCT domain-containing protein [Bradyrhizobium sp. CCGE-LA001]|uniref:SHOCT domain-containing protein n=1 Tax=Bradyrhizobium sp. CCGE-LA001 TaxID=1223566 RepID=UPI0002AABF40